jgi:uncharacterized protein YndB with AHSA1/START domain
MNEGLVLVVRRTIRAKVERVFEAWTQPEHLRAWWGPRPVVCGGAEVDLRVGGHYRLVNTLPDGKAVTIEGEFTEIEAPHKLVYTWRMGGGSLERSRVTVRFEPRGDSTEVIVIHDRLPSEAVRDSHEGGWRGCLEGLSQYMG